MNKIFATATALAVMALAPLSAKALTLTPSSLDPGNFDQGSFVQTVCGPCTAGTDYTGSVTFTFDIVNNSGVLNVGASNSITPAGAGSFTSFSYVIKDGTNTQIATGTFGNNSSIPPDLGVSPGTYTVVVDWTYHADRASSAGWTMNITTAPVQTPEPGSLALLGLGLAGMGAAARRRKV